MMGEATGPLHRPEGSRAAAHEALDVGHAAQGRRFAIACSRPPGDGKGPRATDERKVFEQAELLTAEPERTARRNLRHHDGRGGRRGDDARRDDASSRRRREHRARSLRKEHAARVGRLGRSRRRGPSEAHRAVRGDRVVIGDDEAQVVGSSGHETPPSARVRREVARRATVSEHSERARSEAEKRSACPRGSPLTVAAPHAIPPMTVALGAVARATLRVVVLCWRECGTMTNLGNRRFETHATRGPPPFREGVSS
jgi:hypothetical protein